MKALNKADRDFLPILTMILILGLIIVVICNALFFFSEQPKIVIQSSDSQADFNAVTAVSYAETVSRMAEWTIASVLTLGSALIGLNWYTSNRNYQDERERVRNLESAGEERIDTGLQEATRRVEGIEASFRDESNRLTLAIANSVQLAYFGGIATMGRALVSTMEAPLGALMYSLRTYAALNPNDEVQSSADHVIDAFLTRYWFVVDTDVQETVGSYTDFLMHEAGALVSRVASDKIKSDWSEWQKHFTREDPPPGVFGSPPESSVS